MIVQEVANSYQFCVVVQTQGTVEIDIFPIVVHIIDGTATRGAIDKKRQVLSRDYSTDEMLILHYPIALCHTIEIFDDEILEGNEDFGLTIFDVGIAGDPVLTLPLEKTVIIQDNEGNIDY